MLKVETLEIGNAAPFVLTTRREREAEVMAQTNTGPIDRIIDTVHFVAKDDGPLLQMADACAFSFRHYLAGQEFGRHWVEAMLGAGLDWDNWQGPLSGYVFNLDPERGYALVNGVVSHRNGNGIAVRIDDTST
ncbi:hypothetical protein [Tardiphaga robiniae]|uniref:Uncharacterized protein n=1 Tax=Tardiphaga robiniae TaxID=943830 RepID=A0A7G6U3R1_9BRAD|nr:hypothetical protein [Tardiphaga robiniae]QND73643.1 hypothetical protein HB776_22400 [Tardiphaga robiniae]